MKNDTDYTKWNDERLNEQYLDLLHYGSLINQHHWQYGNQNHAIKRYENETGIYNVKMVNGKVTFISPEK